MKAIKVNHGCLLKNPLLNRPFNALNELFSSETKQTLLQNLTQQTH